MSDVAKVLVVIDLQVGVLADDGTWDPGGVVRRTAQLVEAARTAGTPVVWVQHSSDELVAGDDAWQLAEGLVPADHEPMVHKRFGDAFADTDLAEILTGLEARHLVVAGAQTDACIRSTLHGAVVRGYDVTLVSDCHTTGELPAEYTGGELISALTKINFTNAYAAWGMDYPHSSGAAVPAADVVF